tara:strand:- start:43 stop:594 length:552 start_codon:yes stop_codon:yes gene_type:complete
MQNKLKGFLTINQFTDLDPNTFDEIKAFETATFLSKVKKGFSKMFNIDDKAKEKAIKRLTEKKGKDYIVELKKNYHNEEIKTLVTNTNDENRIIELNNEYVQKINPIFLDPYITKHALDTRAHLFAPRKHFAGFYIDTEYFNPIILWVMTLVLWAFLYFDVFKRVLSNTETLFDKIKGAINKS